MDDRSSSGEWTAAVDWMAVLADPDRCVQMLLAPRFAWAELVQAKVLAYEKLASRLKLLTKERDLIVDTLVADERERYDIAAVRAKVLEKLMSRVGVTLADDEEPDELD